jgi:LysM repeat protein
VGGVRLVNRRLLARYLAPAVFLLAVTVIVLVVRSGLRSGSTKTTTTSAVITARTTTAARTTTRPAAPKRYYVIAPGDTLEAIAARYGTTVAVLLRLNPGVQPTALTPGEQLRVR